METRLTVAALVHWQGRFLMVEERVRGEPRFNQPAGHVEEGDTLAEAVCRELKEESGLVATPTAWLGTSLFRPQDRAATFVRVSFVFELDAPPGEHQPDDPDGDVLACHWWSLDEIRARQASLRSPLVWQTLENYLAGTRLPLHALQAHL